MVAVKKKPGGSREAEIIRLDEAAGAQLPAMSMDVAQVRAALDATTDPLEVEAVRAQAKGLQDALRSPAASEIVGCDDPGEIRRRLVDMAEAVLWAKRRLGELAGEPRPGERRDLLQRARGSTSSTLEEVDAHTLNRYRSLAAIPIAAFEAALAEARQAGREPTQTALLKLAPPRPRPEPKRAPVRPPALQRARRIVAHATQRLSDVASGNPDGFAEVAFVGELMHGLERVLEEQRTPLERAELLLQVVADHLESAVLPKLGAAPDTRHPPSCACDACNNSALMSLEGVVDRLREDASEIERVREGVIAPRTAKDTSYAKPYRIPKPRDDR